MSDNLCSGIDIGDYCSVSGIFFVKDSQPDESSFILCADRNGSKFPVSSVYFDKDDRLTATAADLASKSDNCGTCQYIESSIMRPISLVNEDMLRIFPSMKSDDNGYVVYEVLVDNTMVKVTPAHACGTYIADRKEDIKNERRVDDLNLVLSVPAYFTEDQINLYIAGLHIAKLDKYMIIRETESLSLAYGYYESLHHKYETPKVVMFVGMSFYEAEAFVVRFTNDSFEILSYEHTPLVGTQHIDSLILHQVERYYNEFRDESFPEWSDLANIHYRLMPKVNDCRNHFTPGMNDFEESLPDIIHGDDFVFYVNYDELKEEIRGTDFMTNYRDMINKCLDKIGGVKIDEIEPMNPNAYIAPFFEEVNSVLKERNMSVEFVMKNTFIMDQIARGNTEYAFYCQYSGRPEFESILSPLCNSVKPIICFWHSAENPCTHCAVHSFEAGPLETYITEASALEDVINGCHKRSVLTKSSKNSYSEFLEKIRTLVNAESISSSGEVNEYALNNVEVNYLLDEATKWYKNANEEHLPIEEYEKMREAFQLKIDEAMTRFHDKRVKELDEQRKRQEEQERIRREEEQRKREEEERLLREEQKRMVMHWKEINKRSYMLTECITREEVNFWLENHNRVIEFGNDPTPQMDMQIILTMSDRRIDSKEELDRRAFRVPLSWNRQSVPPEKTLRTERTKNLVKLNNDHWYYGQLLLGVPDGVGVVFDASNRIVYNGEIKNGVYHGFGFLYDNGQLSMNGQFKNGVLVEGRIIRSDGAILIGSFSNNKLTKGRLLLQSGVWIEGTWHQGKPIGVCRVHISSSIEDLMYDFDKPDENTKFVVIVKEDRIFYDNKYLLDLNPVFVFFFNGDVFIGRVDAHFEPVDGIFCYLKDHMYFTMNVGNGFTDEKLQRIVYNPLTWIKHVDFIVDK